MFDEPRIPVLRGVAGWALALLALGLTAALAAQRAAIGGVVRDSSGSPLGGVEMTASGSQQRVYTDSSGVFRLMGLDAGQHILLARRLGFEALVQQVRLREDENRRIELVLVAIPVSLAMVEVEARRQVYDARLAGYNERRQRGVGHFVTRERLDRANSTTLTDMLREVPGVRIGQVRNQGRMISIRGSTCPPLVFVDGFPASAGEFDLDMVDLNSVEGIEVYAGLGSIPPEFTGPRGLDRCGVVALWSRPSRPRQTPQEIRDGVPRGKSQSSPTP